MPNRVCSRCSEGSGESKATNGFLPARSGLLPGLLEWVLWMLMLAPSLLKSLYGAAFKKECPQCGRRAGFVSRP